MKSNQRLDYNRLAEALGERGLVEPEALQHILHQSLGAGGLFPELLVTENHISDWDLSRVICEVFGLPFLPPDSYSPALEASEGIERAFLHEHALVPLDRFGKLLTVAMPGLTPSQILGQLGDTKGVQVLPVVSSVEANRRWLREKLPLPSALVSPEADDEHAEPFEAVGSALPADASLGELSEDWGSLFDEGDAAVLLDLEDKGEDLAIEHLGGKELSDETRSGPSQEGLPELPQLPELPDD